MSRQTEPLLTGINGNVCAIIQQLSDACTTSDPANGTVHVTPDGFSSLPRPPFSS
jgi:hypothetical protein